MLVVCGFSKEYSTHTEKDVETIINKGGVGDIYYYEVRPLFNCKDEELMTTCDEEGDPDKYNELFKYVRKNSTSEENLRKDGKPGYPTFGPEHKYTINLDGKEYVVVFAEDMGFNWCYFTKDFIEAYKKVTDTSVRFDENEMPF